MNAPRNTRSGPGLAWRLAGWAAVLAVLAGVFLLYLQPDMMLTLSQQIWLCFGLTPAA